MPFTVLGWKPLSHTFDISRVRSVIEPILARVKRPLSGTKPAFGLTLYPVGKMHLNKSGHCTYIEDLATHAPELQAKTALAILYLVGKGVQTTSARPRITCRTTLKPSSNAAFAVFSWKNILYLAGKTLYSAGGNTVSGWKIATGPGWKPCSTRLEKIQYPVGKNPPVNILSSAGCKLPVYKIVL